MPMNEEQKKYLKKVSEASSEEILIKYTGREGMDLEKHVHEQYQIIFTLQGTLHITVEDKIYFVPECHICWIPAGKSHSLSSNNKAISLIIYYVPLKFHQNDQRKKFAIFNTNRWASENMHYISSMKTKLNDSTDKDTYTFALSFFRQMPLACKAYERPLKGIIATRDTRIEPALSYINEHLHEDIRLEDVARAAHISIRTLSRLFHDIGIRYNNYLNYQRITHAIELMADGGLNINEIALETGFSCAANFNRTFKQIMGMTPTELFKRK